MLSPGSGWGVAAPGVCGVLHRTMMFAQPQTKGAKKQLCRHDVLVESRGKCCHGWNISYVLQILNAGIFAHLGCISHWVMFTATVLYSSPFTELCRCEHWYFCVLPVAHGSLEVLQDLLVGIPHNSQSVSRHRKEVKTLKLSRPGERVPFS